MPNKYQFRLFDQFLNTLFIVKIVEEFQFVNLLIMLFYIYLAIVLRPTCVP